MTVGTGTHLRHRDVVRAAGRRRAVRYGLRRCRRLAPEEVAAVRETYGLFAPAGPRAAEPVDPALLDRAIWAGLV